MLFDPIGIVILQKKFGISYRGHTQLPLQVADIVPYREE